MVTEVVAASRAGGAMRVAAVRALPTLAVVVAAIVLAWHEQGSLRAPDWLPAAIVVALVLATVLFSGVAVRVSRAALLGLGALVALAAYAALTIAWSPSSSGARDEALLVTLYAACFAIPLLTVRSGRERLLSVQFVAACLAGVGVATCIALVEAKAPAHLYFGGRLNRPISYPNATALFFALGAWPAVSLAARRSSALAVRAGAGGAAALFLALAVAAQSKGALLGLIVSAIVVFGFLPHRLRLFVPTALATVVAAALFHPLTAPYRAKTNAGLDDAVHHVGAVALLAGAVAVVLTALYALGDRRIELDDRRRRNAGTVLAAAFVVALFAGVALFFVRVDHPGSFFAQKWHAFKKPPTDTTGSTHLLSLGSARYDVWRVAVHEFHQHPIAGLGARGYYTAYLREGRTNETPLRAHSLYFDTIAEEGLIGVLLLLVALGAPVLVLWRRRTSLTTAATLAAATVFVVHAGVDWMWTVPPVGMLFFVLLGLGSGGVAEAAVSLPTRVALPVAVAAVLVAAFAFAPPWVADRYVQAAYKSPANAAADLRWARRLDPLSLDPYFARWRLASSRAEQISALEDARRLQPENTAAAYQLGLAELAAGDKVAARRALLDAHRLDPRDRLISAALRRAG